MDYLDQKYETEKMTFFFGQNDGLTPLEKSNFSTI